MKSHTAVIAIIVGLVSAVAGYGVANFAGDQGDGVAILSKAQEERVKALIEQQLASDPRLASQSEQRIKALISQQLASNPEVLMRGLQQLNQRRQQARRQTRQQSFASAFATYREELVNDPTAPVGGNPKGDVTVVEFFDYNCPYCKAAKPRVRKLLAEDPNIRFVYKEFPILSASSRVAARAGLAAARQGLELYERFHDALLDVKKRLTEPQVFRIAEKSGLDMARLRADMKDPEIEKAIKANLTLATRLNVTGTPTFIIDGILVPGAVPIETLRQAVATARAKKD